MAKGRLNHMNNNTLAVSKPVSPTRVITGSRMRFSYCHIWEPKSINGGAGVYFGKALLALKSVSVDAD